MLFLSLLALVSISPAVAQMTKVGQITEFGPLTGALLNTIIKGPDGALWFTEQGDGQPGTSKIGRITTTGHISEFTDPVSLGSMVNLTTGPDGNIWLTESSGSFFTNDLVCRIGRVTPAGQISEFVLSPKNTCAGNIVSGPDGAVWFTAYTTLTRSSFVSKIGRITTSGQISLFPTPTVQSGASNIVAGPDRNLWFTEPKNGIGNIGRITTQ